MQLTTLLIPLTLLLASDPVLAKGDSNSTSSQCRTMSKLTKLIDIANNATRLEDKSDGNATKAAEIQAEASAAVETLAELQSNETLVTVCAQRAAVDDMEDDCKLQSKLQKAIDRASNSTSARRSLHLRSPYLSDERFPFLETRKKHNGDGNNTIDIAAAQEKLDTLAANETLQQFCAARATAQDCKQMSKLTKIMDIAANDTALADKFGDDTEKITKFQEKATKAQTKLEELQANSTLVGICEAGTDTTNADADSEDATDGSQSGAFRLGVESTIVSSALGMAGICLVMLLL